MLIFVGATWKTNEIYNRRLIERVWYNVLYKVPFDLIDIISVPVGIVRYYSIILWIWSLHVIHYGTT
jgi:hypothetical protein